MKLNWNFQRGGRAGGGGGGGVCYFFSGTSHLKGLHKGGGGWG